MSITLTDSKKTHEWNKTNGQPKGNVELWPALGHVKIVLYEYQPNATNPTTHNFDTPDVVAHECFATNNSHHWKIEVTATGHQIKYALQAPGL